jgi:hypothetical protein
MLLLQVRVGNHSTKLKGGALMDQRDQRFPSSERGDIWIMCKEVRKMAGKTSIVKKEQQFLEKENQCLFFCLGPLHTFIGCSDLGILLHMP